MCTDAGCRREGKDDANISDIVDEMRRGFNQSWHDIDREWAHGLADRIEAEKGGAK